MRLPSSCRSLRYTREMRSAASEIEHRRLSLDDGSYSAAQRLLTWITAFARDVPGHERSSLTGLAEPQQAG